MRIEEHYIWPFLGFCRVADVFLEIFQGKFLGPFVYFYLPWPVLVAPYRRSTASFDVLDPEGVWERSCYKETFEIYRLGAKSQAAEAQLRKLTHLIGCKNRTWLGLVSWPCDTVEFEDRTGIIDCYRAFTLLGFLSRPFERKHNSVN